MIKTYTDVRDELIQGVVESTSITNLNPGSVIRTILETIAKGMSDLYELIHTVTRAGFIQTAEGKWLDLKVRELGLLRKQGQKASGYITFYRDIPKDDNITIPAGTIVKTGKNNTGEEYRFKTIDEVILSASEIEVFTLMEADQVGSEYNVGKETITKVTTHIAGINGVVNKNVNIGAGSRSWQVVVGTNTETDDDLRNRAIYRWDELGVGGTADAYRSWALTVDGVKSVQILDDFPFGPGTVGMVISAENGLPTPELLEQVHDIVKKRKPLTASVHVLSPKVKLVDIELSVERFSSFELSDVEERVRQRVMNMNSKLMIGEHLVLSRVVSDIMQVDGVYSVDIIKPIETVGAAPDEMIQIDTVNINQTVKGRSYQDTEIITNAQETVLGVANV
ncbi:MAG: baseplate J/gp47 family protein [Candidatus Marinimicrobia bacterium]|nr:baseplate J/gp47 family protein [Candidatus Neomarinimicrobiota bacterium]